MNINLDYSEIANASSMLQTGHSDITSQLESLRQVIANMVSTSFITESTSHRFFEAYEQFNTSANYTLNALQEMSTFLNTATSAIQDLDNALAARITS